MKRTTFMLDDDLYASLQRLARERHKTIESILRDALARYLTGAEDAEQESGARVRTLEPFIGMLEGGSPDLSVRAKDILRNEMGI